MSQDAEYVSIRRGNVDALLKAIDNRWTPAEDVLKQIQKVLWAAKSNADYGLMPSELEFFRQAVEDAEQRIEAEHSDGEAT